ncbi:MAG: 50S ribosomal protein L9 [Pseudomonadota bacterium]
MKVILKRDVDELGLEGDIVDVAKGYARNYLIPKAMALEATGQNIKLMAGQKKKIEVRRLKATEDAEIIKEKIEDMEISIAQKAGEEDKLYGSVTSMDIAAHLEKKSIIIDRRKIILDKPIKSLGEFRVSIKLYPKVTASLKVVVVPEV